MLLKEKTNQDLRNMIANANLHEWEVAQKLGVSDGTFCKWLRREPLESEKREAILSVLADCGKDK